MDKELIGWAFNILFALLGFAGAFAVNRLAKSVDALAKADSDIRQLVTEHREEAIRNYGVIAAVQQQVIAVQQQVIDYKKDIIGRVDRLEMAFKEALMAHEHREREAYTSLIAAAKERKE